MSEPDGVNAQDWVTRLKDLRRLQGWSQRRLAKELRVTPGAVSQWESGQRAVPGPVQRLVEIYEQNIGIVEGPSDGLKKLNSSWASRTLRSSTTGAAIAARVAGSSLKSLVVTNDRASELRSATQQAIAEQIVGSVGELKGFLMKVGQMASYLSFGSPSELREILQALQDDVRPMSEFAVDQVFLQSLRRTPRSVFSTFEPKPFAAASIGQVHRATLPDGTVLAVKVQYPRIREALESDLTNLGALEALTSTVMRGQSRGVLLNELRERLLEECDYRIEANNQETFRKLLAGLEGAVVPKTFPELSTDRILTSELVAGRRFSGFLREASQEEKDRAGALLYRVAFGSIFKHQMANVDPHPGNYIFTPTGEVAFLDFGCVKRFDNRFLGLWGRYLAAIMNGRREDSDQILRELGMVPDPDKFDFDYQYRAIRAHYEPWISSSFRFNRHYVQHAWKIMMVDNPNRSKINLPPEFVSLSRLLWGLFAVLSDMEARADWRGMMEELLAPSTDRGTLD